jgi:hypothetical protein
MAAGRPIRLYLKLDEGSAKQDFSAALNAHAAAMRDTFGTALKLIHRDVLRTVAEINKALGGIGTGAAGAAAMRGVQARLREQLNSHLSARAAYGSSLRGSAFAWAGAFGRQSDTNDMLRGTAFGQQNIRGAMTDARVTSDAQARAAMDAELRRREKVTADSYRRLEQLQKDHLRRMAAGPELDAHLQARNDYGTALRARAFGYANAFEGPDTGYFTGRYNDAVRGQMSIRGAMVDARVQSDAMAQADAEREAERRAGVLAAQQRQYDAMLADRARRMGGLERAGALDARRGVGFDSALQDLAGQEAAAGTAARGADIRQRAFMWANRFGANGYGGGGSSFGRFSNWFEGRDGGAGGGSGGFSKFLGGAAGAAGDFLKKIMALPSGLMKAAGAWKNFVIGLSATIYSIRRVSELVGSLVAAPYRAVLEPTEQTRKFQYGISGVLGSVGRARDVSDALYGVANRSPYTVEQLRAGANTLAFTPALSSRLTFAPNAASAADEVRRYTSLTQRLGMIDPGPGGGVQGANMALRELFEGDTISLRRRFGINQRTLARMVVKDFGGQMDAALDAVKSDPSVAFQAVEKYADIFLPPEAADRLSKLLSVRFEKVKDGFAQAFSRIGESGVYDTAVGKLEELQKALLDHLASPEFTKQAQSISQSMGHILDNVGQSLVSFLRKLSGTSEDGSTVSGVFNSVAGVFERIAKASDALPEIGNKLGGFANTFSAAIDKAMTAVERLSESIENFSVLQNLWGTGDVDRVRREAAMQVYDRYGIRGAREATMSVTDTTPSVGGFAPPQQYNRTETYLNLEGIKDPSQRALAEDIRGKINSLEPRTVVYPARLRAALGDELLLKLNSIRATSSPANAAEAADAARAAAAQRASQSANDVIESGFSNYKALTSAVSSRTGRFAGPTESAIAKLSREAESVFGSTYSSSGTKIGDVYGLLSGQYAGSSGRISDALSNLGGLYPAEAGQMANLQGMSDTNRAQYRAAMTEMDDMLVDFARNFGEDLLQSLEGASPEVGSLLRQSVLDGTTDVAKGVAAMMQAAGRDVPALGVQTLRSRITGTASQVRDRVAILRAMATSGYVTGDMSAGQIRAAAPVNDRDAAAAVARYLDQSEGGLDQLSDVQTKAFVENRLHPSVKNKENLGLATAQLREFVALERQARLEADAIGQSFIQFGADVRDALQNTVGKGIADLIRGTGSLKDALAGFANDIINAFSQMAARNVLQGLMGDFLSPQSSGQPGSLGGLLGALFPGKKAANGAVWSGGFTPFAGGGIVRRPTLGLVGEGRFNEAIVPLPDGRSIPVQMHGGTGGGPNIYNVVVRNESEARSAQQQIQTLDPQSLVNIISHDIMKGGPVLQSLRRKL